MGNATNKSSQQKILLKIIVLGLMSALVYIGNYLSIPIPSVGGITRIHLGNSMCLLSGLLFGGVLGGVSAGIGGAMYDLLSPVYFTSAPATFITKFVMGFVCGSLKKTSEKSRVILAAVLGQLTYILLYLGKKFVENLILNGDVNVAFVSLGTSAISSLVNGILAVIISVPLYFLLVKALKPSAVYSLLR